MATTAREVEMMIVLERVAELLGSAWIKSSGAKIVDDLGDEITPFFEGLGMTEGTGPDDQECYGFDWTDEQEAVERSLGGRKAVIRRLALERPVTPFDLITGGPVEPWAGDMVDRALLRRSEQGA